VQNVKPSHLLDQRLWSALGLQIAPDSPRASEAEGEVQEEVIPEARLVRGAGVRNEASSA
jgi:hypothetical protein